MSPWHELLIVDVLTLSAAQVIVWGVGTALGELPPYLVAYSHAKAGDIDEDYEVCVACCGVACASVSSGNVAWMLSHAVECHAWYHVLRGVP